VEAERHLAGCAGCQVFWSGLKESLELLQSSHAEPVAPAHYAAVRGRVIAKLESARWNCWRRKPVFGLLAAAAALAVALSVWPGPKPKTAPRIAEVVIPPAPLEPQVADIAPPKQRVRIPRRARHARRAEVPKPAAEPRQPLLVRLITEDPNVVIYWIAD
jgi:hypothetical protein